MLKFRADFQLAKINVSFLTALGLYRLTYAEKPAVTLSWHVCLGRHVLLYSYCSATLALHLGVFKSRRRKHHNYFVVFQTTVRELGGISLLQKTVSQHLTGEGCVNVCT